MINAVRTLIGAPNASNLKNNFTKIILTSCYEYNIKAYLFCYLNRKFPEVDHFNFKQSAVSILLTSLESKQGHIFHMDLLTTFEG